ncbi:carboxypeptidase Taq Metallo peptidase. MEROPS family M32 [Filimonas lacunae]|uniref:Metal-dependent carboxypeptidase n=1 Tax=Filimonas lacunae TaxID=477680 RepID=A0A173MM77_9BACT|nr:carboxypeptidase M32 [Filimonas lacunae]BAV08587.1 thermostable carboxypeptidase 1 [Filimonas lacunae]SIS57809.1 carboxypeptidase Taq Metallo peptidase. MEROPS family M32 [Filimonas lacunae]
MKSTAELYEQYSEHMKRIADMRYAAAVLQWDQETYMPAKGAERRAWQLATLSETAHEMATDAKFEQLVEELIQRDNPHRARHVNVALTHEDLQRQKKLSGAFVRKLSEAVSRAFNSWIAARKANNFGLFEKDLEQLVALKRESAELYGYEGHPYNALIYEYERSVTVDKLDSTFQTIIPALTPLVQQASKATLNADFLHRFYPKEKQWEWGMWLVKELGFDLEAGRQDISEHPFTTNFSAKDVRITTRIDEQDFANMTWSCIHEAGHALYEQGLPDSEYGLPSGEYASLSIHESQSRLWENCVGRSQAFWNHYLPVLKSYFPEQLQEVDVTAFYKGINKVQPSFIRTEADEITYHFHVYIRYQVEKELIAGTLAVKDIPARWNELYQQHLGIKVPDDRTGCLQDVHWSHGSFGYFPTYSMGSFYAAQFWTKAQKDIPALQQPDMDANALAELLAWLRKHIHASGRLLDSEALCKAVTGEPLNVNYFIHYAREKFTGI